MIRYTVQVIHPAAMSSFRYGCVHATDGFNTGRVLIMGSHSVSDNRFTA